MMVEIKTKIDLSRDLKILMIPVKNEEIPAHAVSRKGIVRNKLSKNLSPPLCPVETRI